MINFSDSRREKMVTNLLRKIDFDSSPEAKKSFETVVLIYPFCELPTQIYDKVSTLRAKSQKSEILTIRSNDGRVIYTLERNLEQ